MNEPAFAPGALLATVESSYEQELKRFKRSLVLRTLRQYGWRKAESARALGVARGYLHRLINQLDIRESDEASSDRLRRATVPWIRSCNGATVRSQSNGKKWPPCGSKKK